MTHEDRQASIEATARERAENIKVADEPQTLANLYKRVEALEARIFAEENTNG